MECEAAPQCPHSALCSRGTYPSKRTRAVPATRSSDQLGCTFQLISCAFPFHRTPQGEAGTRPPITLIITTVPHPATYTATATALTASRAKSCTSASLAVPILQLLRAGATASLAKAHKAVNAATDRHPPRWQLQRPPPPSSTPDQHREMPRDLSALANEGTLSDMSHLSASPERALDAESPDISNHSGIAVAHSNPQRDQINPYTQTLSLSDVESCVRLEEAAFPPHERATREKVRSTITDTAPLLP